MILIGIIIGITIMQLISLIVIYATNENEAWCIYTSVFLFLPFIILLRSVVRKIIKYHIKRKKKLEEL